MRHNLQIKKEEYKTSVTLSWGMEHFIIDPLHALIKITHNLYYQLPLSVWMRDQ